MPSCPSRTQVAEAMTRPAVSARVRATVSAVASFPVKGAASASVTTVDLDAAGVVGDRRHAVLDAEGILVTADRAPALRSVRAALDSQGCLHLQVPGHPEALTGPAAAAAVSALLGHPVRLITVPSGSQLDAPVHLVSQQAIAAAR